MIGKCIDVTLFNRDQAIDYILHRCQNCEIMLYCNGNDSNQCDSKIEYLIEKYKKIEKKR